MGLLRRLRRDRRREDSVRWVDPSEVEGLFWEFMASYTDDDGMGDVEYYILPGTGELVRVKRPFQTFPLKDEPSLD